MQMSTTLSHASHGTSVKNWIGRGLLAAVLVTTTTAVVQSVVNGPKLRAAAESVQTNEIDQENRTFCSAVGAGHGTAKFTECGAALSKIRARQAERSAVPVY